MIDLLSLPSYFIFLISFLGGLMLGFVYFHALHKSAVLIVSTGNPLLGLALTLGRMGMLVAILYIAVLVGGGTALFAALAGILCARMLMLRRLRSKVS